ncbi:MAG: hypothetical protein ABIA02_03120 [Candidatus Falkowbacteria bacterium]
MKITICGSMAFSKKMIEVKQELEKLNHQVVLPKFTEEYAKMETIDKVHTESAKNKVDHDLIREYFNEIKETDAILVVNEDKNGTKDYIGGNSFLEMGFAHILNKKIFLLYNIPEIGYKDEIEAMQPISLNNDLTKIK